ncbi:MAG: GNAT family N-acetyltransferase [Pseudomarimonas sp.]
MPPIIQRRRSSGRWCEDLVLGDGRQLHLRPIVAEDADALRHGFELLDADEVRMRFMHPMSELTPELAKRLSDLNPKRDFAIVAAEPLPPGEALVGAVVRASIAADGRRAEFAILVSRLLAGQGLGRLLMKRIIRWAKLKRLDELYGDVLEENSSMLKLASSLGFRREHQPHDPGVVRVRLALRKDLTLQ